MYRTLATDRAASGLAMVVACVLLVCGFLMGTAGANHAAAMSGDAMAARQHTMQAMAMEMAPSADAHASVGMDSGCVSAGADCPLASALSPAPVAADVPAAVPTLVAVGDYAQPEWAPAPDCVQPRAPDLRTLCISRT